MGCLINNLYTLNNFNESIYNIPGIKKVYVSKFFSDVYSKLNIFNNLITNIDASIKFIELDNNKFTAKYSWEYNYSTYKYEHTLNLELLNNNYIKRNSIDSLIKSNLIFIIQDMNNHYFFLGEKGGMKSINSFGTTDVYLQNKNTMLFTFFSKSDSLSFGVSEDLIKQITEPDCENLYANQSSWSSLFWLQYSSCLVGSFPNFIEP